MLRLHDTLLTFTPRLLLAAAHLLLLIPLPALAYEFAIPLHAACIDSVDSMVQESSHRGKLEARVVRFFSPPGYYSRLAGVLIVSGSAEPSIEDTEKLGAAKMTCQLESFVEIPRDDPQFSDKLRAAIELAEREWTQPPFVVITESSAILMFNGR